MLQSVALFALGAAATTLRRQSSGVDAIISALNQVTTDTKALTTGLENYVDINSAIALINQLATLNDDTLAADNIVKATSPLTCSESLELVDPVTTLAQSVIDSVNAAFADTAKFANDGISPAVGSQLQNTSSYATPLSNDLVAIIDPSLSTGAQALSAQILGALQSAIDFFNQSPSPTTPPADLVFTPIPSATCAGTTTTTTGTTPTPTTPTGTGSVPPSTNTPPVYYSPPPVYSSPAPPPVYSSPAPVYSSPAPPVYSSPAPPVYSSPAPPVYSSPAPPVYSSSPPPVYSSVASMPPVYSSPAPPPVYSSVASMPPVYSSPAPPPSYSKPSGSVPPSTPSSYSSPPKPSGSVPPSSYAPPPTYGSSASATHTGVAQYTGAANPAFKIGNGLAIAAGFAALAL